MSSTSLRPWSMHAGPCPEPCPTCRRLHVLLSHHDLDLHLANALQYTTRHRAVIVSGGTVSHYRTYMTSVSCLACSGEISYLLLTPLFDSLIYCSIYNGSSTGPAEHTRDSRTILAAFRCRQCNSATAVCFCHPRLWHSFARSAAGSIAEFGTSCIARHICRTIGRSSSEAAQ